MEFKIDTRKNYTRIMPVGSRLNANMAAAIEEKYNELAGSGSENFLIDLSECGEADKEAFAPLGDLHGQCYANGQSMVVTGIAPDVMQLMKEEEMDLVLNIAPTEGEAVDIINMEILERDLFNEES